MTHFYEQDHSNNILLESWRHISFDFKTCIHFIIVTLLWKTDFQQKDKEIV